MTSTRRNAMYRARLGGGRESGAVLAVSLILLLVMTLLAVLALRGTLLEARMAAGQKDRSLSFQSAEAALRVAEVVIAADSAGNVGRNCVTANVGCGLPDDAGAVDGCANCWVDASTAVVSSQAVGRPQYLIQRFDSLSTAQAYGLGNSAGTGNAGGGVSTFTARGYYRVFARSHAPGANGSADRAFVVLTANYAIPLPGSS